MLVRGCVRVGEGDLPSGVETFSEADLARWACLSSIKQVATPRLPFLSNSKHFCAAAVSSTTILSKAPQAVLTATSYCLSMAPKSPAGVY